MTRDEAKQIFETGTLRDQIKLYFNDLAYFNIKGLDKLMSSPAGDIKRVDYLLNDEERQYIWNSITSRADINHYEKLRQANALFVSMRAELIIHKYEVLLTRAKLNYSALYYFIFEKYLTLHNYDKYEVTEEILELFNRFSNPDKGGIKTNLKNFETLVLNDDIESQIAHFNDKAETTKLYITGLKLFCKKRLNIKVYNDYLKAEEAILKTAIKETRAILATIDRENDIAKFEDIDGELHPEDKEYILTRQK